jgi:plasmid stabilization system protein ParE
MARSVVWTETAWRDLEHTADYIAEDSPGYAAAFVQRIRDHARALDEFAHRGGSCQNSENPPYGNCFLATTAYFMRFTTRRFSSLG